MAHQEPKTGAKIGPAFRGGAVIQVRKEDRCYRHLVHAHSFHPRLPSLRQGFVRAHLPRGAAHNTIENDASMSSSPAGARKTDTHPHHAATDYPAAPITPQHLSLALTMPGPEPRRDSLWDFP
jgi:hypothetical protein